MDFGEKFKSLVENSGESYETIAAKLGLKSRSSVSHYMNSISLPKHEMLVKMCSLFDVPMSFFDNSTPVLHQNEIGYQSESLKLPIMSSEKSDAVEVGFVSLPHTGITDGFAVVLSDDRLESIGISKGSTVILSKTFTLGDKHRIVVSDGDNRFFARYEKIRENYAAIIPANPEISPIMFEKDSPGNIEIYAVVKYVMSEE
ncbi:MAG: helix-turn-helix domain-containing protein [Clostridia bacterium]|nr:helix-turn-helix domain-containing protein [Clostridia bacterium]